MLRFAVCDDAPADLERSRALLDAYREARPAYEVQVSCYDSPYRLLNEFECGNWHDVYLLDILMPGMDGVELGKALRRRNDVCAILFGTITPEYALASYHVGAQNYLLKPFQREELFAALDRAVRYLDAAQARGVGVRTDAGVRFLPFCQITCVESRDRAMVFHLADGGEVASLKLRGRFEDALADLLTDPRFCQPHKSFVVNMDYVRFQGGGYMELPDHLQIPVARARRRELLGQYIQYSANEK